MPRSRCSFCDHQNPIGSRFCNECGSPLHLAPCPNCESLNDETARTCHHCGMALVVERAGDAVTVGSQAPGALGPSADGLTTAEPLAPAASAPTIARDGTPAHVPETLAAALAPRGGRPQTLLAAGAPLPRSADAARATRARRAPGASLVVVMLVAAFALVAYFTYRPPTPLNEQLARAQFALLGAVHARTPAARPEPRPPDAVPSRPAETAQAVSAHPASDETTASPPAADGAGEPPVGQGADATPAEAAPSGTDAQSSAQTDSPSPMTPAPPATATPAPPAGPAATREGPDRRAAAAPRRGDRGRTKRVTPSFERAPPPEPPPMRMPIEEPAPVQSGPCTRAVAALGLCNNG